MYISIGILFCCNLYVFGEHFWGRYVSACADKLTNVRRANTTQAAPPPLVVRSTQVAHAHVLVVRGKLVEHVLVVRGTKIEHVLVVRGTKVEHVLVVIATYVEIVLVVRGT